MRHFAATLYIATFCIILLIPIVMWLTKTKESYPFFDNRKQAQMPDINIGNLDPVPPKVDSFINDHFPLRNTAIHWLNYTDARYLGKSPKSDVVTVGSNGWLYPGGSEIEFLLGIRPVSDSLITLLIKELNSRYDYCKERGAEFRLVIVPAKSSLYPQYLPFHYRLGQSTPAVEKLLSRSKKECRAPVLYLLDSLNKYKQSKLLYLKSDTHWNDYGTYCGYRSIMQWLGAKPEALVKYPDDFEKPEVSVAAGNLSSMLGLGEDWNDTVSKLHLAARKVVPARIKENYPCDDSWFSYCYDYECAFGNSDTTLPGLLVIRDSFTNELMQNLLATHYGRSTFIWDYWQHKLNKEILEKEKPDVVLCIMNERFLMNPVKYPNSEEKPGTNFLEIEVW